VTPTTPATTPAGGGGEGLLEIGYVVKAHGLQGEVVVGLITNRLDRLDAGQRLAVRRKAAEALRGSLLLAPPVTDPDALYVHELIGSEVVEQDGTSHGIVVSVEANPASDLLVGEAGWLVPLRFVVERRGRQIVVDAPEGLFE
jgi:16S rRNA processing protein RimM